MVSERRTADSGSRTPRAELALKTLAADLSAHDRLRRTLEQTLVFARACAAALYTVSEGEGEGGDGALALAESVGVPRTLYGLRDAYPLTTSSPLAEAHADGHPRWLTAADLARRADPRSLPPLGDFFLGVLPLRDGGCLVAVREAPEGFEAEDRACLTAIAEALTTRPPAPDHPPRAVGTPRARPPSASPWTPAASRSTTPCSTSSA